MDLWSSNLAEPLFHHQYATLINTETHVILFQRSVRFKKQYPKIKSNKDGIPFIIHASLKTLKRMEIHGSQEHLFKFPFLSNLLSYFNYSGSGLQGRIKSFLFHSLFIQFFIIFITPPHSLSTVISTSTYFFFQQKILPSCKSIGGGNWTSIYRILLGEVGKGIGL